MIFVSLWFFLKADIGIAAQSTDIPKRYKSNKLEVPACDSSTTTTTLAPGSTLSKLIECVVINKKYDLGAHASTYMISADVEEETLKNEQICSKQEGSNIHVQIADSKTKSIIYADGTTNKILFVGAANTCYTPYMISKKEYKAKYVHVSYIKCFLISEIGSVPTDPKLTGYFVKDDTHLCFLNYLLTESITISITHESKPVSLTVSPFPERKCECPTPKCLTTATPVASNTTSASQKTTIIVSVVVIVVIIILAGGAFVLMKK